MQKENQDIQADLEKQRLLKEERSSVNHTLQEVMSKRSTKKTESVRGSVAHTEDKNNVAQSEGEGEATNNENENDNENDKEDLDQTCKTVEDGGLKEFEEAERNINEEIKEENNEEGDQANDTVEEEVKPVVEKVEQLTELDEALNEIVLLAAKGNDPTP